MNKILIVFILVITFGVHAQDEANGLCNKNTIDLFQQVAPTVVLISGMAIDPYKTMDRVQWGIGSGVIIDDQGLVLTNSHVVYGLDLVAIGVGENKFVNAEVLGADPIYDLAVVRMKSTPPGITVAKMGNSDSLLEGEEVIAIGNSLGLERTVSQGIISGLNRVNPLRPMGWLVPFIQTDAAISPGNSGGPLVNRCGEVIGINSASIPAGENIGFSIPINIAKEVIPELVENGRVIRPWYGINGKLVDFHLASLINYPLVPGFLIETIEPGSPADKAGLHAGYLPLQIYRQDFLLGGDIITSINGERITSNEVLLRIANSIKVGDTVALEYYREDHKMTVEVEMPERPVLPGDVLQ